MTELTDKYIVCCDSGVGGIPVFAELRRLMPYANLCFFADTAYAPYGDHSREEILQRMLDNCAAWADMPLLAVVIACNTATAAAIKELRYQLQVPVLGIEPALKPAVQVNKGGRIVILATALTVRENKLKHLMEQYGQGKNITTLACSGLMELVEEDPNSEAVRDYLQDKLAPYAADMEGIVLGCTHYTYLKPQLKRLFPDVQLFDGAFGLAKNMQRTVLQMPYLTLPDEDWQGLDRFICTESDPAAYAAKIAHLREFYKLYLQQEGM